MKNFNYKIDNKKFYLYLINPGSEIDYNNIEEMTGLIKKAVEEGYKEMYFDFKNLKFIDSSGLGRLITASKQLKVVLLNVSEDVMKIFKITNITAFFNFE